MSQIFDALHESVAESVGSRSHGSLTARDLLQVVERRNASLAPSSDIAVQSSSRQTLPEFPSVKIVLPEFSKFVCFSQIETLAAEKFRFLATRLRHIQQKRFLKRLVVTSSVAGEGKSMVAANLSHALAAGKQQVLLLEGDLRRPSLGEQLGQTDLPGLSQVLLHTTDGLNIYRLEGSGLCILLAGNAHSNPLEFMEPTKLSNLLDRISAGFDWVVIDSPPVLPLADTSIWMRLADAILLVTRPGITPKQQLLRSLETIEQSKLLGSVLNASTETTGNGYYYQYSARSGRSQAPTTTAK